VTNESQSSSLLYGAIAVNSAASIAYQLAIMQVYSITQWGYMAYFVISVALLGFGAAGSVLALFKDKIVSRGVFSVEAALWMTSLTMVSTICLTQSGFIQFDAYMLYFEPAQVWSLALTTFVILIPFFFSAMAVGISFVLYSDNIGTVYFSNMIGAGVGGVLFLGAASILEPLIVAVLFAMLPVAGCFLIGAKSLRKVIRYLTATAVIVAIPFVTSTRLIPSEFKDISYAMNMPGAEVLSRSPSLHGEITLVRSPSQRFAPGMSLRSPSVLSVDYTVFSNGNMLGTIVENKEGAGGVLGYTSYALPFEVGVGKRVLSINPSSDAELIYINEQRTEVTNAVIEHPIFAEIMQREVPQRLSRVQVVSQGLRSWLIGCKSESFDIITLPYLNSPGGSMGKRGLEPEYTLTLEAFSEMWRTLDSNGIISARCWIDYPARTSLKLAASIMRTLKEQGVTSPEKHIAVVRGWSDICFLTFKSEIMEDQQNAIISFCSERSFDISFLAGDDTSDYAQFNKINDRSFHTVLNKIITGKDPDVVDDYPFDIAPASDDIPFFSNYLKVDNLKMLSGGDWKTLVALTGVGYLTYLTSFVILSLMVCCLITLPLHFKKVRSPGKCACLIYFAAIGLAYMFVELAFIERFILYFGAPVYSISMTISVLLISSGLGSLISEKFNAHSNVLPVFLVGIMATLILFTFTGNAIIYSTVNLHFVLKVVIFCLVLSPLGFIIGIPFPLGIRRLTRGNDDLIAWSWGINGGLSVIGAVLAMILAAEFGYTFVACSAVAAYGLAMLASTLPR